MCKKVLRKHEMEINEVLDLLCGKFPMETTMDEFYEYLAKRKSMVDDAVAMRSACRYPDMEMLVEALEVDAEIEISETIEIPFFYTEKDRSESRRKHHAKRKEREEKLERKAYKPRQPKQYKRNNKINEWEY